MFSRPMTAGDCNPWVTPYSTEFVQRVVVWQLTTRWWMMLMVIANVLVNDTTEWWPLTLLVVGWLVFPLVCLT